MQPQEILLRVLYRDDLMLVINKPAGIPVHAGPKGGENLEQSFEHLRFGLPQPPGLAHRLDRDTSGCLILGRHRKALAKLGRLFEQGKVEKVYWALVEGKPEEVEGVIDLPLAKKSHESRSWHMKADPAGQRAVTEYKVLGEAGGLSWLELRPRTGRTHQLRVHAATLGFPIRGDSLYGSGGPEEKLLLHAQRVRVPLYPDRPPVDAKAPPPAHMLPALLACGFVPWENTGATIA
jgi:RluA family pseudouridine synthase